MSDPILRDEFNRVLDGVSRSEARLTERIDSGFENMNGRVRTVEARAELLHSRVGLIERVVFAGIGLFLSAVLLALINLVERR